MNRTGIEWLPEIRVGWEVKKVKDLFYLSKQKAQEDNPVVLSLARSGVKVRDITNNEGQLAESYEDYNPVIKGDLLLNPMDLYSGANCNVSEVEGVISPAYSNLRAKVELNPYYFDYYFKIQYWTMAMFAHGKGVSFDNRWTLNTEGLLNYEVPFPSKDEQDKIVEALKSKLAKVDSLILNQEKQIERLKNYKVSLVSDVVFNGLENKPKKIVKGIFFSELPENYRLLKMNEVCDVITDYVASGSFASLAENVKYYDQENYAMLIRTADVSGKANSSGRVFIDEHAYNFLSNSNLFGGEIMLPNIGASVGDVYVVPKLYERMSLAPNSIIFKSKYNDKFFYYYFVTKVGRKNLENLSESTAQPKFNKTKLRAMRVPVPEIEEQNLIVEYLDKKCAQIDKLIQIKQSKIEKLNEYKKSLIYEYVTGKREVKEG